MEIVRRVFRMHEKKDAPSLSAAQARRAELRDRIVDQLEGYDEWDTTHNLPRSTFYVLQECLRWLRSRPWPEPPGE